MTTKLITLTIITLLTFNCFVSCKEDTDDQQVVSIEKMAKILFEYHVAGIHADRTVLDLRNRQVYVHELTDGILKYNEVDRIEFYDSYHYYASNPELMDSIYNRVISQIEAVHDEPDESIAVE